ncbi:MAG: hypothetical protein A3F83_08130 [Candidatus Glassbacteria bacterium RIFCSPLOWO2_12_FULL_58_11]|uniref:Transglutaminase-like domain-containing protein n=1 Tax=Candidatus Glassbacteria bacterium RIFCSPLOWO2_12_FULL_58_11 TaxID=1817867 RepID=A0A1F5YJU2_9BACT|nr:MAG: hypothetical protein A3F83_08130 [Candidatus Glassbacteria bacterium RIFCSPLOWO2_12_FULL_58_11]
MSKSRKFLFVLPAAAFLVISIPAAITLIYLHGDQFHPASRMRSVIWLSKRAVAEAAGALVSVYDPYRSKLILAQTGPAEPVLPQNPRDKFTSARDLQRYFDDNQPSSGIVIETFTNDTLPRSRFPFLYQTAAEPLLDSLRTLYNLEDQVRGVEDDFEVFKRLTFWLHLKFYERPGLPKTDLNVNFNFNALDILYQAGRGQRFWCSELSTTLVQCLAALGYTARYVMLDSENGGHVVCEAWCETFGKWLMLDPTYARIVTVDGIPQSVYELHCLLKSPEREAQAAIIQGKTGPQYDLKNEFYFSLYRNFAVRMRNDWFTNRFPRWYPLSNSVMNAVEWQDELTSDNVYYKNETGRLEDLYWPLDRVRLSVVPAHEGILRIFLDTFTPNFSEFEIQFGADSLVTTQKAALFWSLEPGVNRLHVRSVNQMGIRGRPVRLEIRWNTEEEIRRAG